MAGDVNAKTESLGNFSIRIWNSACQCTLHRLDVYLSITDCSHSYSFSLSLCSGHTHRSASVCFLNTLLVPCLYTKCWVEIYLSRNIRDFLLHTLLLLLYLISFPLLAPTYQSSLALYTITELPLFDQHSLPSFYKSKLNHPLCQHRSPQLSPLCQHSLRAFTSLPPPYSLIPLIPYPSILASPSYSSQSFPHSPHSSYHAAGTPKTLTTLTNPTQISPSYQGLPHTLLFLPASSPYLLNTLNTQVPPTALHQLTRTPSNLHQF